MTMMTTLQSVIIIVKKTVRGSGLDKFNWETIFCGHHKSIFNLCDVISLQSYQIR